MNTYVTGGIIKKLREKRGMTQAELAEKLSVSDKAISKWETGKGYPDIALLEPLSETLGVSISALLAGSDIANQNRSGNMLRSRMYVCPICGNVLFTVGEAEIHCCGLALPPLEAEPADREHPFSVETIEDEYYITLDHPMTKTHYVSFIAVLRTDGWELHKLYPEGEAAARIKIGGARYFYYYCNRHGLFKAAFR